MLIDFLAAVAAICGFFFVGGVIAEYVLPRIPVLNKWLEKLYKTLPMSRKDYK